MIDAEGSCSNAAASQVKNTSEALLQVQVDALVFLVHLLSDPSAIEPWREKLPATIVKVLWLARCGALAAISAQDDPVSEVNSALAPAAGDPVDEIEAKSVQDTRAIVEKENK